MATVLLVPFAPTAAAECEGASAAPVVAADACAGEGVDARYDVFVPSGIPTGFPTSGMCYPGQNVRGDASTNATVEARHEFGMRCDTRSGWTHRDNRDENSIGLRIADSDGDGMGDSPHADVCRQWTLLGAGIDACADVPGEKNGLARVYVPTEVWMQDGFPCARMAVVETRYEGDGAAPDAEAGFYENVTVWCVHDHPGVSNDPQSPSPVVVLGVRDSDGDGVADEPHASSSLLP